MKEVQNTRLFNRTITDIQLYSSEKYLKELVSKAEKRYVAIYEHQDGNFITIKENSLDNLINAMFENEQNEDSYLQGVYIDGKPVKLNYKKVIIISVEE